MIVYYDRYHNGKRYESTMEIDLTKIVVDILNDELDISQEEYSKSTIEVDYSRTMVENL